MVSRLSLAVEILALRQQISVYKHTVKCPKLRPRDRIFWVWLSRLWANWRSALGIVQPEMVIHWHRQGFKLYWRWKSRVRKPGRPPIPRELRDLIRRLSRENPLWGAPRILSELLWLGYDVAEQTVSKYMVRTRKPPSQTWRTFLDNHVLDIAACDFFTIPTVTFRVLYVFIVLRHDRRQVVHVNITTNCYAEWTAQQIINAFPYEGAPRFLIREGFNASSWPFSLSPPNSTCVLSTGTIAGWSFWEGQGSHGQMSRQPEPWAAWLDGLWTWMR